MKNNNQSTKYLQAKDNVEAIKKFYNSLLTYAIYMSLFALFNYWVNRWAHPWFLWIALWWGIGLVFKAFKTFNWLPFMNREWEDRKIKEFMSRESNANFYNK